MIDPRREAVLIADSERRFSDRIRDVHRYETEFGGRGLCITFSDSGRTYRYGVGRVLILRNPVRLTVPEGAGVEVQGVVWESATEVWTFAGPPDSWWRVFYGRRAETQSYSTYPSSQVHIVPNLAQAPKVRDTRAYWRAVVSHLPADDPLRPPYDKFAFVHPDSVLGRYLAGDAIEPRRFTSARLFPFRSNLSQRQAVENALTHSVSLIEGPPGTGKTETILNLIATILATGVDTVGVVSFTNAAVNNVREKIDELGFGHVVADLGSKEKMERFLGSQGVRNSRVTDLVSGAVPVPPQPQQIAELGRRVDRLQETERSRAVLRQQIDAYQLELKHFERHLQRDEVPELAGLPLLRRSSDRILDYLVESDLEPDGARPGLLRRIRKYFRYGSLRGLDPQDTSIVLRLQQAFYHRRIGELNARLQEVDDGLRVADFEQLVAEHSRLSGLALHAALDTRYRGLPRTTFPAETYRQGRRFAAFTQDYPVLLSTCHSLPRNLARGYLLDYLIIDEASQVNLLAAGLALASCRNLVVVGDRHQLPHIPPGFPRIWYRLTPLTTADDTISSRP